MNCEFSSYFYLNFYENLFYFLFLMFTGMNRCDFVINSAKQKYIQVL